MKKKVKLIIYGGKLKGIALGGHLWLSEVSKLLASYKDLNVKRVEEPEISTNRLRNILNAYIAGYRVLSEHPDSVIIDAGKDGNAAIALLHKFISRRSKLYPVVHHYEPITIGRHNIISYIFAKILQTVTFQLNKELLRQASAIFTVSDTSKNSIVRAFNIPEDKVVVTGVGNSCTFNPLELKRDVHFLCIGRIGKFLLLDKIWNEIRRLNSSAVFYMIGTGKTDQKVKMLYSIGNFEHKGVVSEEAKAELLSRSKVFLFPSLFEGFGIAVAEALSFGLPVVVWDLPVYKEVWGSSEAIRTVKIGDYVKFAREAIYALENFEALSDEARKTARRLTKSWNEIAKVVYDVVDGKLSNNK